ncbi:MAG: hypothetical protein B6226_02815 [Candidatus Cloacimonetes bacterium 4572_65]|nr:MAG: hypothetical protein B6226_02815 [Candidatus Cloacimonetes bacterium 4572_65]
MTKSFKIFIVIAVMLCLVSVLFADNNHNKPYLRMGLGAKGMAMGGTGTAYMNNITATYWNPAGLSKIVDFELGVAYTDGLGLDRSRSFAGVGVRYKFGYIALSWLNSGVTDIAGYDDNGNATGDYDVQDNNLNLSLASRLGKFHWGLTMKMLVDDMDDESKSGFSSDLGVMYDVNEYMTLGAMARNIYGEFDSDNIPVELSLGVAVFPVRGLTLTGDFRKEEDADDSSIHLGAEYWTSIGTDSETGSGLSTMNREELTWESMFANVQGGVRVGANDGEFTAGFGLRFSMIEMNYAFVKDEDNGINQDTHRYDMIFRF